MKPESSTIIQSCALEDRSRAKLVDFGCGRYEEVLEVQERLRAARREGRVGDVWLAGEHPFVITQGVRGKTEDVVGMQAEGAIVVKPGDGVASAVQSPEVFQIDRGGMTTLHSPGQLILYPIIKLGGGSLAAARLSNALLRSMRDWVDARFGVAAERVSGAPGLYVESRKLMSIGISVRGGVSMHGIALNLSNDLELWSSIVACGEAGMKPISIAEIVGEKASEGMEVSEQMASLGEWLEATWGYGEVARPGFEEFKREMERAQGGQSD